MSSPAALTMVTDDFSWISPQSMSDLFEGDEAGVMDRLKRLRAGESG